MPFAFLWTVRTRSLFPVTALCPLVSIKRTQLFSLQAHCESYPHGSDQCQASSASRKSPLVLLLPISLAMISLYAPRPTWELRRAAEFVWFLVVCVCVFLTAIWVTEKTKEENKQDRNVQLACNESRRTQTLSPVQPSHGMYCLPPSVHTAAWLYFAVFSVAFCQALNLSSFFAST